MTFKAVPLAQETEERKQFHKIFNDWLSAADEGELAKFEELRERVAPNQVCSAISLVCNCCAKPDLERQLPETLRQLLQERNWRPAYAGGQSL